MDRDLLDAVAAEAARYAAGVRDARVAPLVTVAELTDALGGPLPDDGEDPRVVVERLVAAATPGLVASTGPRYFGFVIGGALPAAAAADMLTAAWDQNAGMAVAAPAAAAAETVAAAWVLDLLGLPAGASVGFVTGAQAAITTGLAAGRHEVLRRAGWDVERDGLQGAPRVTVLVGEEVHVTVLVALRLLGLGEGTAVRVPADDQGRMRPDELRRTLAAADGPVMVAAQAGCVTTGAIDPLGEIAAACRDAGAWLHVDGAFGLWAAASPARRASAAGVELADSWSVDFHKWLNVPYDSAAAIVAHPRAHVAAMSLTASYLHQDGDRPRDPMELTPEASRRARGFAVWAALRQLGRSGVAAMVDRFCDLAARAARAFDAEPGVEVVNDVTLNQVLVALDGPDDLVPRVLARVQRGGVCWLGGAAWRGRPVMRLSVSNWMTTDGDVDVSVEAILAAVRAERAAPGS